ncbi:sca1 complex scaffold protein scaa [Anaeramoeba flamelloides]|uniref:Sca1 complex scaffold protein scaa n=1 Tax=Anaeramoeba flamelloides TaxID=1746091 RepID=A0ABQ8Z9P4_9EUKA|nr:sca1 complex scaffold protein scaa [Anaeramoeba flamelloides]
MTSINNSQNKQKSSLTNFPLYYGFRGNYKGPLINTNEKIVPTKSEHQNRHSAPVFVDSEGNMYDINYLPIKETKRRLRKTNLPSINEFKIGSNKQFFTKEGRLKLIQRHTCTKVDNFPTFPNPQDYQTFTEFEQASVKWYQTVQKNLGVLKLPKKIGAQSYRIKEELKSEEQNNQKSDLFHNLSPKTNLVSEIEETEIGNVSSESLDQITNSTEEEHKKLTSQQKIQLIDLINKEKKVYESEKEKDTTLSQYLRKEDPWDTHLVPEEPQPEYYLNFTDYQRACRRWTQIVSSKLKKMPMHPRQLQQQALLKSYKKKIQISQSKSEKTDYFRGHFQWIQQVEKKVLINSACFRKTKNLLEPVKMDHYLPTYKSLWVNLSKKTRGKLSSLIEKLSNKSSNKIEIFGHYTPIFGYSSSNNKNENKTKLQNFALLRDLPQYIQTNIRNPCQERIGKSKINFIIPDYDFETGVPWKDALKLKEYPKYRNELQKQTISFRFQKLYLKYSPNKQQITIFGKETKLIELKNNIYYLYYLKLILRFLTNQTNKSVSGYQQLEKNVQKKIKKINKIIFELIEKDNYLLIKNIFEGILNRSSKITIFNLFLLKQILNIEDEKLIKLIQNNEISFPYFLHKFSTSKYTHTKNATKTLWEFLRNKNYEKYFANYYSQNAEILKMGLFSHPSMKKKSNERNYAGFRKSSMFKIHSYLQQNKELFDEFEQTNSKGENESFLLIKKNNLIQLPSFLTLMLTEYFQKTLKNINDDHSLIDFNSTELFAGRFCRDLIRKLELGLITTHLPTIYYISNLLYRFLKALYNLNLLIGPCFSGEKRGIELLTTLKPNRWFKPQNNQGRNLKKLVTSFVKNPNKETTIDSEQFPTTTTSSATTTEKSSLSSTTEKSSFSSTTGTTTLSSQPIKPKKSITLITATTSEPLPTTSSPSLSSSSSSSSKLNKSAKISTSLSSSTSLKMKHNSEPPLTLGVRFVNSDIYRFFKLVHLLPNEVNTYQSKIPLLKCLKYLLRERTLFLNVYDDGKLFDNLKQLCYNTLNSKCNELGWKLFYQSIAYHSETCNWLTSTNTFKAFLMPPNDPIGITHQLKYLYKLLRMPEIDEKRTKEKKKRSFRWYEKDPKKSLNKDRKLIINYLVKKLWHVRLHMIYKRFVKKFAGKAFIQTAKIFSLILKKGAYSKLYKSLNSQEDYIHGLLFFQKNQSNLVNPNLITSKKSRKKLIF